MNRSERIRWGVWLLSGLLIGGLLLWGGRRTAITRPPSLEAQLDAAFWKAEAGEPLQPQEKTALTTRLTELTDSVPRLYAQGVVFQLLYGEGLSAPPMVYVQRLRQLAEDPWVRAYLGRLAWYTGQLDKARAYLQEALTQDSSCVPAYLFLARVVPDSACYWLDQAARHPLSAGQKAYLHQLKSRQRCL